MKSFLARQPRNFLIFGSIALVAAIVLQIITAGRPVFDEEATQACISQLKRAEKVSQEFTPPIEIEPYERGSTTTRYSDGKRSGFYKFRISDSHRSRIATVTWSLAPGENIQIHDISIN